MKTPLIVAKAAVKAAAEEMGISYKKALTIMLEDYCGASSEDVDGNPTAKKVSSSHGPSTMAREILKGILENPHYYSVPQYVFSIKQLNREDQAFIIANLGSVAYGIQSAIMAGLEK